MIEHPDVAIFRQVHASFSAGDMDALSALLAGNIVWHTTGPKQAVGYL